MANERETINLFGDNVQSFEGDMARGQITKILQDSEPSDLSSKKRKTGIAYFFLRGSKLGSQPTIKVALQSKEWRHEVDLTTGWFFYDAYILINVTNSFYFQPMIDVMTCMVLGYIGPTYHALRTNLIEESKKRIAITF